MDSNLEQVGGDHYASEYQHWDFVEEAGMGYLEGCATKYIVRWRTKNGRQDLEKAVHYIAKLIEHARTIDREPRGHATMRQLERFREANTLSFHEEAAVHMLSRWHALPELHRARYHVDQLIMEANHAQAD